MRRFAILHFATDIFAEACLRAFWASPARFLRARTKTPTHKAVSIGVICFVVIEYACIPLSLKRSACNCLQTTRGGLISPIILSVWGDHSWILLHITGCSRHAVVRLFE
ncbi:hypothetical protein P691DRAFT_488773 [Macrolepiota fuliginosa MF-IS2]|uniref:Uncharacterized protein n=1 Tax=Macrolepiota fuliginosa MF-IS2 TaxID=1400762 RepID=A0A9P6C6L3_9AGAR|nr:hypothetical protein P691DRAFT_488773 [Macrolepiota fuliginosa MF-IS2]